MELLNLDEIVVVSRQVTLKGEKYNLATRSVGQMISSLQNAKQYEQMDADSEESIAKFFASMVDTAQQILPDCPKEVLETMDMNQLNRLIEFANASDQDVVDDGASDAKSAKKSKGDKGEGKRQPRTKKVTN